MIPLINDLIASVLMALRQPIESYIRLETSDDDTTLVASDGSLVSVIKLFGARQNINGSSNKRPSNLAPVSTGRGLLCRFIFPATRP